MLLAFRDCGRDNPSLGIHPNVQFLPALVLLLPVLLGMPFALAADLQATAVYDQAGRFLLHTLLKGTDIYRRIASRQRRVIGAWKRQSHELQNSAKKPFGLAQRQMQE